MQACALGRTARYVLVQALEDDGMDKEEAVKRVQRATADMHAILGALECASDFATQVPCSCGGITNAPEGPPAGPSKMPKILHPVHAKYMHSSARLCTGGVFIKCTVFLGAATR